MSGAGLRLGLDTATAFLALALVDGSGGVLARHQERADRAHAALALPRLRDLLAEVGAAPNDLVQVTAGVGPGSYTGVRVGLAVARGLAAGGRAVLGGADTLAMLAWGALADGETGVAAVDARRGAAYVGVYRREGARLVTLAAPTRMRREDAAEAHPDATWIEDRPPDAAWAAARSPGERAAAAVYL